MHNWSIAVALDKEEKGDTAIRLNVHLQPELAAVYCFDYKSGYKIKPRDLQTKIEENKAVLMDTGKEDV